MKTEIIKHSYFPEGALLLIVNGEVAILYQTGKNSALHLWLTYEPFTDMEAVNKLLSECAEGMHSDKGTSVSGSLQDIIEALEPAPQTDSINEVQQTYIERLLEVHKKNTEDHFDSANFVAALLKTANRIKMEGWSSQQMINQAMSDWGRCKNPLKT